jgi:hypothetical protein
MARNEGNSMIQRERAASGEAERVSGPAGHRHAQPKTDAGASKNRVRDWEDLYHTISSEQQRELLSLAQRQGVLYAHQLAVTTNGTTSDPNRQLLSRILNGDVTALSPLQAEPFEVDDSQLDIVQREAVAKALTTPDILLVQGRPGSGKARVVAEMISQATERGERVLLLSRTTPAIDRVLELVACRDAVFPVRCVDRDENVAGLPEAIRALTFVDRVQGLTAHALACARRQAQADEQRARRLREDEPLWARVDELSIQWTTLENRWQALQARRSHLADDLAELVPSEDSAADDSFVRPLRDLTGAHDEARILCQKRLSELRGRIDDCEQGQAVLDADLQALQPLVEAKQQGRWWTPAWWQATVRGGTMLARWAEQQERRRGIQADLESARGQSAHLTQEWEETERLFAAKKAELISAEITRRQADLDDREAALRREQDVLQQKWQGVWQSFASESAPPAEMTPTAVQAARSAWYRQVEQAEAQHAFARQWSGYLEQTPKALTGRLSEYVNLVAATVTGLSRDDHFGDGAVRAATLPDFDLMVLKEADQISEAEFLNAARRARRCVLIGEAGWADEEPAPRQGHTDTAGEHKTGGRPRAAVPPRGGVFQRLWQHLHCDPRHLPYTWIQEQNRLCCRLRPLAPEQRQWVAIEHVADFPAIELRILTAPGCQPVLVEIVFPTSFSIDRAKEYIFQELEELAVQASGSSLRWLDEGDRLVLRLADRDLVHGPEIHLVPGVREVLGATASGANGHDSAAAWQTCCLEFDRGAGWNRPRAAEWVREHLGLRDLGRTIRLDVCYRMEAKLAAFVTEFLAVRASNAESLAPFFALGGGESDGWSAAVEFVPVPKLRDNAEASGRGKAARGPRALALPHKGGTGLEVDLADPRLRERLPTDLRPGLPTHGLVNYSEAQAVVRTLVGLEKEMGLRELGTESRQKGRQLAIVVLALYAPQAELIRRLIQRESVLAGLDHEVQVGVPATFRHGEAAVVLLSLTRSHTHRAVTFGEGPQMLAVAMTRARSRLIVFGDPGTLVRRSQWEGPLDHLDEIAAARERQLITRLVHCLQSCASGLPTARLRQGSGA